VLNRQAPLDLTFQALADPARAAPMVAGASAGWRQTLDKLEAEIARMALMTGREGAV
jgi:hypothetical protein